MLVHFAPSFSITRCLKCRLTSLRYGLLQALKHALPRYRTSEEIHGGSVSKPKGHGMLANMFAPQKQGQRRHRLERRGRVTIVEAVSDQVGRNFPTQPFEFGEPVLLEVAVVAFPAVRADFYNQDRLVLYATCQTAIHKCPDPSGGRRVLLSRSCLLLCSE
jgi:hypothetical protein